MKIYRNNFARCLALLGSAFFGIDEGKAAEATLSSQRPPNPSFEFNRSNALLAMKLFEALKTTNTYSGMSALASSCKQLSGLATNELFLAQVLFSLNSRNPSPLLPTEKVAVSSRVKSGTANLENNQVVIRQDILIQGGRAAWLLEQMLSRDLPIVSAESSEDEFKDSVLDAHYAVRELLLPPEAPKSTSGYTAEQKQLLAMARDSNEVIFWKLAKDENAAIRRLVAANKDAPLQVLSKLGRDKDAEVKRLALKNLEHARSLSE